MALNTGFVGINDDGTIVRYAAPGVVAGGGSASNPAIAVPATGTAVTSATTIPTGRYVFVASTGGAASLVTGTGSATYPAAGFSYPAL